MAKDIGSYFLEQGEPILTPKPKPKEYTIAKEKSQTEEVLDILNTKAASTMLSPRTYVNLIGQTARKAYDQKDISASDYYNIVMPLFGEKGEMVTEKIKQYDAELDRYADGGRVNFGIGAGGSDPKTGQGFQIGNTGFRTKDGEVRNVKGSNQFNPKTTAQIQAIIDKPAYKNYTPTRFEKEKILTRTDTKNKDVVFQKKGITPADPEKQKTQKAITQKKRTERLKKISNPNIEKKIAGKVGLNLSHIGQYNTPVTLSNLAYLPADVNRDSYEKFEKKIQNNFNKILTVYRNKKLKPEVKTEKIAALMKEDRQLRSDNPKYANIKSRMSVRRTALDPSGIMIKEKIRDPKMTIGKGEAGLNLNQAKPRSPERKGILTIARNALQNLKSKGAPGLGSGEFKDPLGGQIDLIDVQKLIKRPDNV
tara:strand:- start:82 stop:1347 length:1266 start_codon:yes stop_codon:yes gene_type:complete